MEERSVGTEEQVMSWLFEAMDGLSMQGMKCEMTLFLPAPEDSPALGQPAVRAGEDIFTVTPLEADDNDIFIFSIISGGPGQEEKTAFRLWEFPWAGAEIDIEELMQIITLFDKAWSNEIFEIDTEEIPEDIYRMPRINGLYACLAEIGAEPELTGSNEGGSVRINDGKITIELSYLRTVFPETWILVLKCAEENGKSITLRIPEYGGLKAPEEYGRLLEAAEILNSGSMMESKL